MVEKVQKLVAEYKVENFPKTRNSYDEKKFTVKYGEQPYEYVTVYSEKAAEFFRQMGIEVEEKVETSSYVAGIEYMFLQRLEQVLKPLQVKAEDEFGHLGKSATWIEWDSTTVSLTTDAKLRPSEHLKRREIVERFLKEEGINFTLDCRVELSSNVCKPISLSEPELESLDTL